MSDKRIVELNVERFDEIFGKKRDCYKDLERFIHSSTTDSKICALFGLRRTGKTVLMRQMAKELDEQNQNFKFYNCKAGATMDELEDLLDVDLENGIKYVFIDEITALDDFQEFSASLADVYATQGMKIVITGTDSLGIVLSRGEQLLDRVNMIHTSYISYGEFHRLLGKSLEDYILYGGTLTDSPYKNPQDTKEYVNSAIVNNIVESLEKSEGIRKYPPSLTEFYNKEEIVSTLNKMINLMNQNVTLKAVLKDYKNAALGATGRNMRKVMNYKKMIDVKEVTRATKEALSVKNISEMETSLSDGHLRRLKEYLQRLDLLLIIPVYDSLKQLRENDERLEILMQPGMVYTHSTELMKELLKDESWIQEYGVENKLEFMKRAERHVKGIILENAVIANTYLNYGEEKALFISKLHKDVNGKEREADMILVDEKKNESYLFEVKYSESPESGHLKHLVSEEFMDYVAQEFGEVVGKYLVYNGPTGYTENVFHINAEEFFYTIYQNKENWKEAIRALEELAVKRELTLIVDKKKETLENKISECKGMVQKSQKKSVIPTNEVTRRDGRA